MRSTSTRIKARSLFDVLKLLFDRLPVREQDFLYLRDFGLRDVLCFDVVRDDLLDEILIIFFCQIARLFELHGNFLLERHRLLLQVLGKCFALLGLQERRRSNANRGTNQQAGADV